jgi:hypothetical protein
MSQKYYNNFEDLVDRVSWQGKVAITLDWELPKVIRSGWDPARHVVLFADDTSTGSATATTCTEYISKTWGDHCSFTIKQLLDYIELIWDSSDHERKLFNSTSVPSDPGLTAISHSSIRDTRDLH